MRHPTEGVLRRLLDEPAGVADADREHVPTCPPCRDALAGMREDAVLVDAALATDVDVDVDAAWQRLSTAVPTGPTGLAGVTTRASGSGRAHGARAALRRPAVAAVAVAAVLTGASAAAANDWLQIFRTEEVAPVGFSTTDLLALPDLRSYGDLEVAGGPDVHEVDDAATAAAESGLDVPEVTDLPPGISGEPRYQVGAPVTAIYTFSAERVARVAEEAGETPPPPPPGIDGSSVRLVAGPGVMQIWSSSTGRPALVVGRAVAPTASSSGVPFETLRDYLLSLPGLPEDVARQLRAFTGDGSTLPLPVPADQVTTTSAEVDGAPATVVATRDRTLAGVVWVDDEVVTLVAGALDADEVLEIAEDLR